MFMGWKALHCWCGLWLPHHKCISESTVSFISPKLQRQLLKMWHKVCFWLCPFGGFGVFFSFLLNDLHLWKSVHKTSFSKPHKELQVCTEQGLCEWSAFVSNCLTWRSYSFSPCISESMKIIPGISGHESS